ncbi:hypothetical protein PVAND_000418 [Polypedilum vanderplanki]|uniref:alkaline phosphatase n=1 Tax=Polypedilum vanderplanki TaxID=319348 RepID=A0A9J6BK95_POLVA|nr:hypothetical protein PVAND_000418 [Polypedilum vanderplanki]
MRLAVIYRELFLLLLTLATCRNAPTTKTNIHDKSYWYDKNYKLINDRMGYLQVNHLPRVKNVVIFIGDGMGTSTITASRVYKRQISQNPNARLTFDDFPATAIVQTDIENSQIPESAASSTALFCGVKTNYEYLGIDVTSTGKKVCEEKNSHTPSIISWAQEKNLKTGFVTTTRVTHATPASLYAHSRRHMEDDSKGDTHGCKDVARQLIENKTGKNLNVIMGGGMMTLIKREEDGSGGRRKDGKNLTAEWLLHHPNGEFVTNRDEMMNISHKTEHVLGIFARSHMEFNADRNKKIEPSLAEMTLTAIEILKRKNQRGFLLVVEGGKIDLAHHQNQAYRALDDTLAFDEAIKVAMKNLDLSQTLIIVTSDHSSAMSYSGFATPKNQSILGMDIYISNIDQKPYQILTYSSGIGYQNYTEEIAMKDFKNAIHKSTVPTTWSNHGGEDVPLYAIGPMSTLLFSGTFDQTYMPHAIAYAMCIFKYESRCQRQSNEIHNEIERPQVEEKTSGIEALRKELYKAKNENQTVKIEEQTEIENITISTTESNYDENLNNDTFSDSLVFESSDLVSNLTTNDNENSSSNVFCNSFVVVILVTLLSIKF